MHASWLEHSALRTHSGRQLGGAPTYPGKHEQAGIPAKIWHCELGPHGDGKQEGGAGVGSGTGSLAASDKENKHITSSIQHKSTHPYFTTLRKKNSMV
jgi:hypothetical protein